MYEMLLDTDKVNLYSIIKFEMQGKNRSYTRSLRVYQRRKVGTGILFMRLHINDSGVTRYRREQRLHKLLMHPQP